MIDERIYYHALYAQIMHWTAFYATVGLLITLLFLLSTTKELDNLGARWCKIAAMLACAGSWFFLWRVHTYASVVQRMLPDTYTTELSRVFARPPIVFVAGLGTLTLTLMNIYMAMKRRSG